MEKTVLQQKETYMDSVHRWGRIRGLSLMLLILAYPITVSLIFHAQVNWPAFVKGFIAIGPMYWAVGIVEIFTYVPMLGAGGSYLIVAYAQTRKGLHMAGICRMCAGRCIECRNILRLPLRRCVILHC